MIKKKDFDILIDSFYLQNDEKLNKEEAWPGEVFPEARMHYFRESGCVVTSLFNMLVSWGIDLYNSPWDFNEKCKEEGMFYPTANIELTKIGKAAPVNYRGREAFDESRLRTVLEDDHFRCLVKVNGDNSDFHYILALPIDEKIVFWDPAKGISNINGYEKYYEIILFSQNYEVN